MNKSILMGRLTKEVDLQFLPSSGKAIAKFTIAVPRAYKKEESDFINCIAFDKRAETIATYFEKGQRILIEGRIQTGSYNNKEGKKVYTFDVVVDNFEFVEKATGDNKGTKEKVQAISNLSKELGIEEVTPTGDEDLPW